jgi:hypothetical protein
MSNPQPEMSRGEMRRLLDDPARDEEVAAKLSAFSPPRRLPVADDLKVQDLSFEAPCAHCSRMMVIDRSHFRLDHEVEQRCSECGHLMRVQPPRISRG